MGNTIDEILLDKLVDFVQWCGMGQISSKLAGYQFNKLLQIAQICDRRNEWTEEKWITTLTNCLSKEQYILITEKEEIIAFSCWLFLKDLNKIDNKYVEDVGGSIAYIQCAYVKEGHKGLLNRMIREGVERHKDATHIFFCSDKLNNRKFLIPVNKWRSRC